MSKTEYKTPFRVLCWILFALYLAVLVYFLFFADMLGRTDTAQTYDHNLTLFREIRRFWVYREKLGFPAVFLNLAGNVLVFMPFGFLLPILSRRLRGFFRVVLLGMALSLSVECIQYVTNTGCFDVDDLLLNTIGTALGFLLFAIVHFARSRRRKRGRKRKPPREEMW